MTSSVRVKQVLAVVPAEAGGRAVGTALSSVFGSAAQVTVVETADEDKAALGQAQVILTGLGPVGAGPKAVSGGRSPAMPLRTSLMRFASASVISPIRCSLPPTVATIIANGSTRQDRASNSVWMTTNAKPYTLRDSTPTTRRSSS
jgi:hypothetical protein